ncbi:MAG: hypothetical protein MMC33_005464 [Icmadophila ericetorum]|nr:hypothetical protein [Icmadophila ericetorum]
MAGNIEELMAESPEPITPMIVNFGELGDDVRPRLKGRHRLLQSLQKMSSSPSLVRLGRPSSPAYRSEGRGSMSCVSLASPSSPLSYGHSHGYFNSSPSSAGFSTAPTSVASTPGGDMPFFDSKNLVRIVENRLSRSGAATPISVPLPADRRIRSRAGTLGATPGPEGIEDYFSRPVTEVKKTPKRENFDFWGELPDEITIQILRMLKPKEIVRCSAVSKRWHKMCFDGQLWTSLDATEFYQLIPSESLMKIMTSAGPFVKDLNLRGCVQMPLTWGKDSHTITEVCNNLEYLCIEGCRIDRTSVHYFLLCNPRLVHINVSTLEVLDDASLKLIAQGCPQLEHLNVSWCKEVTTQGLLKVIQECPNLKDLRAGEIKGWNNKEVLLELFNRNTLERLVVSHCENFDDQALQWLLRGEDPEIDPLTDRPMVPPRKLRHLDLSRCRALTSKGVKTLAYTVPKLIGLQLSQCQGLTDDALTGILASTPLLTHLDVEELEDLSNTTLVNLSNAPCASRLEHLSISYCEELGDTGMLPVVKSCPKLKSLHMDNTKISDLVLTEVAALVRQRNRKATLGNLSGKPRVGVRMEVYDCQNVTWTGVREVLSRNAEFYRQPHGSSAPQYPCEIISLKCFYGYQPTVEEHTKRVLRGELARASLLERKWAEYMIATEEAGAQGSGARRRRRRAREAAMVHADEEEGGVRGGRRRARSGGCTVM